MTNIKLSFLCVTMQDAVCCICSRICQHTEYQCMDADWSCWLGYVYDKKVYGMVEALLWMSSAFTKEVTGMQIAKHCTLVDEGLKKLKAQKFLNFNMGAGI